MARLRPPSFRQIGASALGLLVLVTVLVVITHVHGNRDHHQAARPSTTGTSSNPSVTSSLSVTPALPSGIADTQTQLNTQVVDFIAAYNLLLPDDQTAERIKRLTVLGRWVSPAMVATLPLTIDLSSGPDTIRRTERLTVTGLADSTQLIADSPGTNGTMRVDVPVVITIKQGDAVRNSYRIVSTSTWRYKQGTWTILTYSQGGAASG